MEPTFLPHYLAWLDLGGIYAVAHVRGGGELGREWYEAGRKAKKAHRWHDLIDCADALVHDRWTSPARLAVNGISAGGILVGRAMVQRPDLFAVAIWRVGVPNMARAEFSPLGPANVPEFGSVLDPATAADTIAMDSYISVRDGIHYPSALFLTGLSDARVPPWQAAKMVARLQAASSSNMALLRVEKEGGHGPGTTRAQNDTQFADIFSFALWRMGRRGFQPAV